MIFRRLFLRGFSFSSVKPTPWPDVKLMLDYLAKLLIMVQYFWNHLLLLFLCDNCPFAKLRPLMQTGQSECSVCQLILGSDSYTAVLHWNSCNLFRFSSFSGWFCGLQARCGYTLSQTQNCSGVLIPRWTPHSLTSTANVTSALVTLR